MRNALFGLVAVLAFNGAPILAQQPADLSIRDSVFDLPSPRTAQLISLGATLGLVGAGYAAGGDGIGPALVGIGLLVGPSAGHFYGGAAGRGLLGIGVRAGGAAIGAAGVSSCNIPFGDDGGCGIVLAGIAVVLTSAIFDLVTVDNTVRSHNADARRITVAPYVEPVGGGVGAVLTIRH
ncbi:MAG: hypothetical protein ABFS46_17015 [Myxococcota bacterium]